MGNKTVKVKYTEDASIAAFSQSKGKLLKLYPEDALKNIWGNIIVPLYGDGHFYYRKDLGNGEMLICGECYSCTTEERYQEELGTYEHEHRFSDIGFIKEDSLVDDDEGFTQDEWDKYKEEQETKLMERMNDSDPPVFKPELRAY